LWSFDQAENCDIEEKNVTTPDPEPTHLNQVVQTAAARVEGLEFSGDVDFGQGVNSAGAWLTKTLSVGTDQRLTLDYRW